MDEFELGGLSHLQEQFGAIPDQLARNVLKKALLQSAKLIQEAAKNRVPVNTGSLRDSIHVVALPGSPTRAEVSIIAGELSASQQAALGQKSAFYALFIERGTIHMPAHPFMRPALDASTQAVLTTIANVVEAELPGQIK